MAQVDFPNKELIHTLTSAALRYEKSKGRNTFSGARLMKIFDKDLDR